MSGALPLAIASDAAGSPERFGYEWHAYAEMRPEYEEQFQRWTQPLTPADWRGKSFLDVGCMGRNRPCSVGCRSGSFITSRSIRRCCSGWRCASGSSASSIFASRRLSLRHLRSIVFDQMLPKIADYWARATVEALMREAGLAEIELTWVNQMSWSAVGVKPAGG